MVEENDTVYVKISEALKMGDGSVVKGDVLSVSDDGEFEVKVTDGRDHNSVNPGSKYSGFMKNKKEMYGFMKKININ